MDGEERRTTKFGGSVGFEYLSYAKKLLAAVVDQFCAINVYHALLRLRNTCWMTYDTQFKRCHAIVDHICSQGCVSKHELKLAYRKLGLNLDITKI